MSDDFDIQRMQVLWKIGRDKFFSFFSTLEEVRKEIGDEAFPSWCFNELEIGLSVIVAARNAWNEADAKMVKDHERERKLQAREYKRLRNEKIRADLDDIMGWANTSMGEER
jgi:hypothetical protein